MLELGIVDLGMGNLRSVLDAFTRVGVRGRITCRPEELDEFPALVLPGVGTFAEGMDCLSRLNLDAALRRNVERGKPLIGICLGMQLLAEWGDECGTRRGLGLVQGTVRRLPRRSADCRIPNIGWCDVKKVREGRLSEGLHSDSPFYFAHSYHLDGANRGDVVALMPFGEDEIVAVLERDHILGVQFHPEKSQDAGLDLVESFVRSVNSTLTNGEN